MSKRKRWTIEEISNYVSEYNYELISTKYETQKDRLEMICPDNHTTFISFDNFKRGRRCSECQSNIKSLRFRKNANEIKEEYEKIGYIVLKGLDTYENQKSPLLVQCDKGHTYPTYYQCLAAGSKCPKCFGKHVDFEVVKNKFNEMDYIFLENSYVSSDTKMKYICNKHPDEIQYVTWDNLKQDRACRFCGIEKVAESKRLSYKQVQNIFKDKGYILIDETYKNNTTKMKYKCSKHRNEIQETDLNSVLFSKNTCSACIRENYSGRNNHLWKNGKSNIINYLRKSINEWKLDSMKNSEYRCIVTGNKFDVIHHLYSFNKIVDETFDELGLKEFKSINEYTDEELLLIKEKCLEIHYRYPLGVCLSEYVHRQYHSIYGFDNTPEQFYEFIDNQQ